MPFDGMGEIWGFVFARLAHRTESQLKRMVVANHDTASIQDVVTAFVLDSVGSTSSTSMDGSVL